MEDSEKGCPAPGGPTRPPSQGVRRGWAKVGAWTTTGEEWPGQAGGVASCSHPLAGDDPTTRHKPRVTPAGSRHAPTPPGLPRTQAPVVTWLGQGAGSLQSVPALSSSSYEPSGARAACPGLQRREPVPGEPRVAASPCARPGARPATAQGEGRPQQPLRGTVVRPANNFNCQSDLMGY